MIKIEIEIDEGLVPEGYEAVAISYTVKPSEVYLNGSDWEPVEYTGSVDWELDWPVLILEKKKRWRADIGGIYYFVSSIGKVIGIEDHRGYVENERFEVHNYYKTKEEAEQAAERVRKAYLNE